MGTVNPVVSNRARNQLSSIPQKLLIKKTFDVWFGPLLPNKSQSHPHRDLGCWQAFLNLPFCLSC